MFGGRWHLALFAGAKTDSTANQAIPIVSDPALTPLTASQYLIPEDYDVFGAWAANDTITRARIVTESLRTLGLPEIYPLNVVAEPTLPLSIDWRLTDPINLVRNDSLSIECSNGASAADFAWAAAYLRRKGGAVPVPNGPRTTLSGTSTQTLVANALTSGGITFDQTPPVGTYEVIGLKVVCADAWAARLIFPAGQQLRPGVMTGETVAGFEYLQMERHGKLGAWGRFHSVNLPQLEILGHTAGAETARVYLDVVQVSVGALAA